MSPEELAKLTPEEKRVSIASICFPQFPTYWDGMKLRHRYPRGTTGPAYDYLGDLNAMHEAEKTLSAFARDLIASHLVSLLNPGRINGYDPERHGAPTLAWHGVFTVIHATAAQRADAFLLTVDGKDGE